MQHLKYLCLHIDEGMIIINNLPYHYCTSPTTPAPPLPLLHLPYHSCTSPTTPAPPLPLLHLPYLSCTSPTTPAPPLPLLHLPYLSCTSPTTPAPPLPLLHLPYHSCTPPDHILNGVLYTLMKSYVYIISSIKYSSVKCLNVFVQSHSVAKLLENATSVYTLATKACA